MLLINSLYKLYFSLSLLAFLINSQKNGITLLLKRNKDVNANKSDQVTETSSIKDNLINTEYNILRYLSYDDYDYTDSDIESRLEETESEKVKDIKNSTINPLEKEHYNLNSNNLETDLEAPIHDDNNEAINKNYTYKTTNNTEIIFTEENIEKYLTHIQIKKYMSSKIIEETILNNTENELFSEEFSNEINISNNIIVNIKNDTNQLTEEMADMESSEELSIVTTEVIKTTEKQEIINSSEIENVSTQKASEIIFNSTQLIKTTTIPFISTTIINKSFSEVITSEYLTNSVKIEILLDDLLSLSKEKYIKTLDQFILSQKIGNNYKYSGNNFTLLIKPTNSNQDKDMTNINFENCENILRKKYNIPKSSILTLLQIEIENNSNNYSLNNQIEYRIYDENKKPLDISICKDTDITIYHSLKEDAFSLLNKDLILEFKKLGINVFDINDPFFKDLCVPFSYQNIDIILEDRYNIIYQNFSFCEEGCNNTDIDFERKFSTCQCKVKNDMNNKLSAINFQQINEIKLKNTNIDVMKCYKLIFKLNNKSNNYGFIIFTILLILFIINIIIHIIKGINSVSDFIYKEMIKYNYLKEGDKKFFENDKNKKIVKTKNIQQTDARIKKRSSVIFDKNKNKNKKKDKNIKSNKKTKKEKDSILNMNKKKSFNNSSKRNMKSSMLLFPSQTKSGDLISNPPSKNVTKKKRKSVLKVNTFNKDKKEEIIDNFGIIKIKLDSSKEDYSPISSYKTLHNIMFKDLNRYENRNFFLLIYIFLLTKQIIFHTFLENSPLVPFQITLSIFIFTLCFDLSINGLLYTNSNISKKYGSSKGLFSFTLSNNTLIIIISTLVSFIFIPIIIKFSRTDSEIRKVFTREEKKLKKNKNYTLDNPTKKKIFSEIENILKNYKIKLALLLTFEFCLIVFFLYFITAFCQVYPNTQINWLFNSLSSVLIRFIFEVLLCTLGAKLYHISSQIEYYTFYKVMLFVYDFSC